MLSIERTRLSISRKHRSYFTLRLRRDGTVAELSTPRSLLADENVFNILADEVLSSPVFQLHFTANFIRV